MGDRTTLARARQELEDLYLGVPDDSVDLTLKDLPSFQQEALAEKKALNNKLMEPIKEVLDDDSNKKSPLLPATSPKLNPKLTNSPSLDFAKGLSEARVDRRRLEEVLYGDQQPQQPRRSPPPRRNSKVAVEKRQVHDDASVVGGMSEGRGGRRRPGIPHTNICALCSAYIRFFRHRCLVCGRVYCSKCVGMGMGEMTEGRKCVPCLGRKYNQRYIQKAGQIGCCLGYPSFVKLQELIWAEKGPGRSNERRYETSNVASRI